MFTGLISHIGKVKKISHPNDWELLVEVTNDNDSIINFDINSSTIGASISCSGICLTLKKVLNNRLSGNKAILKTRRNDYLGVLASKFQPFTGVILVSFLVIHLLQLRFPRPGDNLELISLKNKLGGIHILALYSLASISLFFHMVQGIESGHRSLGILSQSNSLNIRYISRFISIIFGLSYLIMTFYLRFK